MGVRVDRGSIAGGHAPVLAVADVPGLVPGVVPALAPGGAWPPPCARSGGTWAAAPAPYRVARACLLLMHPMAAAAG